MSFGHIYIALSTLWLTNLKTQNARNVTYLTWKMETSSINVNYMIQLSQLYLFFSVKFSQLYRHKCRIPEEELQPSSEEAPEIVKHFHSFISS